MDVALTENDVGGTESGVPELEIKGVSKLYGDARAVDDVSLTVRQGEFITILGASGSGKTTTLMMIAGFYFPTAGEIKFRGRNITYMPPHLRNIGMVFQSYALFPHLSVFKNIAFPLKLRRVGKAELKDRVDAALDLVQLGSHSQKLPGQLSGGQQQRVALARALVFGPSLLLMDEPLGALDKSLREQMQLEIKRVQAATGVTILSVTHDQDEALAMSDRIVVMDKGRVEVVGSPQGIYERPASRMVAEFMKETNILSGRVLRADGGIADISCATGLTMRAAIGEPVPAGALVTLCLRPERIGIHVRAGEPQGLPARVRERVYLGDVVKYHVILDGTDIELVVKALATADNRSFMPGANVYVAWSDNDVQVLPHAQ